MTDEELRTLAKYIAEELQTLVAQPAPQPPQIVHGNTAPPAVNMDGLEVFDYERAFG